METWLIILLSILWYLIGAVSMLWLLWDSKPNSYKEITLTDLFAIIAGGVCGLIVLVVLLLEIGDDIVIYRKKK